MEPIPQRIFIGVLSTSVILVLIFPWILAVLLVSFTFGYLGITHFDSHAQKVSSFIEKYTGYVIKYSKLETSSSTTFDPFVPTDPLQHQLFLQESATAKAAELSNLNCNVCSQHNCKRNDEHTHHISPKKNSTKHSDKLNKNNSTSTPTATTITDSPKKFQPTPFVLPKVDDLKIDLKLDESISRFCTTVFDYYVAPNWAPYETRKQLKLAMKKFLYTLGERINSKFILSQDQSLDKFCKEKLIPLLFHYFDKIISHFGGSDGAELIFPEEDKIKVRLKMRKLCRLVLNQSLTKDDHRCKLWIEICIAVLSDGVLWNVMMLGRDKLPELLEYYVNLVKIKMAKSEDSESSGTTLQPECVVEVDHHNVTVDSGYDETDGSNESSASKINPINNNIKQKLVPFLLDSFLDRKDSLEQPDPIVSRWRPALRDIIEETELLYPLIQYLKHIGGQKTLAYLQAVLDESPDAKDYCKRILEVEYLPGFCRSHFFHESMGLSRVEQGTEVITYHSPGSSRRMKTHSRSASYGSKSNPVIGDFLKMDGGVVEGLPLHYDSDYGSISAQSSTSSAGSIGYSNSSVIGSQSTGMSEPDSSIASIFKRKRVLEDAITTFFNSTLSLGTGEGKKSSPTDPDNKLDPVPRVGIHAKSYEELNHPDVNSRVTVDSSKCDILERISDILSSSINVNPWLGPILSSWLGLLHPYIKPYFDIKLEENLNEFLSLDLLITSVDLITNAFIYGGVSPEEDEGSQQELSSSPKNIPKSQSTNSGCSNSNSQTSTESQHGKENLSLQRALIVNTFLKPFINIFISKIISLDKFLSSFSTNRDYIFLFFIDVLDLLVNELFHEELNE